MILSYSQPGQGDERTQQRRNVVNPDAKNSNRGGASLRDCLAGRNGGPLISTSRPTLCTSRGTRTPPPRSSPPPPSPGHSTAPCSSLPNRTVRPPSGPWTG